MKTNNFWGWFLFLILAIIFFSFMIYMFKKNYKEEDNNLSNDIKKQINSSAQNLFENIFFNKKQKKKRENKTENKCRSILEKIYNRSFPSIRPDYLKNPKTGKNLELDCYNDELKLALEYNGIQHYKYSPYFHKSKKDFYSQVHRDDWKRDKCQEMGITLIEVPHWVASYRLEPFIVNELKKKGKL